MKKIVLASVAALGLSACTLVVQPCTTSLDKSCARSIYNEGGERATSESFAAAAAAPSAPSTPDKPDNGGKDHGGKDHDHEGHHDGKDHDGGRQPK